MSDAFRPNVIVLDSADEVATLAADLFVESAKEAIEARGRFVVALAGGSTPEKAYGVLATRAGIDWGRVYVFVGDERMVPPDDPRSNIGMARRALLDRVPILAANVFPVPTDLPTAGLTAHAYEQSTGHALGMPIDGSLPRFDLIFLGLGDDGHTASLFPGKPALDESRALVVASPPGVLPPPVDRVTFTFPLINAARRVVFLVTGAKKAAALRDVLDGKDYPAARVKATTGELIWLVDREASGAA